MACSKDATPTAGDGGVSTNSVLSASDFPSSIPAEAGFESSSVTLQPTTTLDAGSSATQSVTTQSIDITLQHEAGVAEAGAAPPLDARAVDSEALDGQAADAAHAEAAAPGQCVPTNPATEVCDRVDNDCNGLVDDVDESSDGIFDCLRIGLFGAPGSLSSADFVAWLGQQGPTEVTRVQTDNTELSSALLTQFSIIVIDQLVRPYTETEAQLLANWVSEGGGLITMTGYIGSTSDYLNPNTLLAPYGISYSSLLQNGPITSFADHPTVAGLTTVTFSGGREVVVSATDAAVSPFVTVATLPSGDVGAVAGDFGSGRVFVWGDEWIEFDSEWAAQPDVPRLWANVTSWVAHLTQQ